MKLNCFNKYKLTLLYVYEHTYILPHVDICCAIWGHVFQLWEKTLVKPQQRAAKALLNVEITFRSEIFLERVIY